MFIDSGRILGVLGKEPPLMTTREELKVDKARDEWRKLIALADGDQVLISYFIFGIGNKNYKLENQISRHIQWLHKKQTHSLSNIKSFLLFNH